MTERFQYGIELFDHPRTTTGIVSTAAEIVLHVVRYSRLFPLTRLLTFLGAARLPEGTRASNDRAPINLGS